MNLVSHYAGGISATTFLNNPQGAQTLDTEQGNFDNILEQQLNLVTSGKDNLWSNMGIPAGFEIQHIENINTIDNKPKINYTNSAETTSTKENITTSETVTFSSSILNDNLNTQNCSSNILNYVKKQAANHYSKCAGNVITDLNEFINDVLKS